MTDVIADGSTTSYDPATGTGTETVIFYVAGNGVSCKGASVVNTANAQLLASGTADFAAVAEPALHLDAVITSFTDTAGAYGGSVLTNTLYRQDK